ncbi:MAG: hypothetical protein IPJ74_25725 [Saprospiraceae bacterium]|nr:hypothetical protein [Saprospiraceae bacterium]
MKQLKILLKSTEIDPNHAINNGNYANFLNNIKKDFEAAEKYYLKVLEIDPNHALLMAIMPTFLITAKKILKQLKNTS